MAGYAPSTLTPGQHVRLTQRIVARDAEWPMTVEGEVVACSSQPTGSWYAHGKGGRLWLPRIRLRLADGELADVVLDPHTRVEVLDGAEG